MSYVNRTTIICVCVSWTRTSEKKTSLHRGEWSGGKKSIKLVHRAKNTLPQSANCSKLRDFTWIAFALARFEMMTMLMIRCVVCVSMRNWFDWKWNCLLLEESKCRFRLRRHRLRCCCNNRFHDFRPSPASKVRKRTHPISQFSNSARKNLHGAPNGKGYVYGYAVLA